MRIKLASWSGDHAPGEEIDVDEVTAKALRRDGLVAEAVETPQQEPAAGPATEGLAPETGRKRR